MANVLVAGGGGFIGGHLVGSLLADGHCGPRGRREAARRVVPGPRRRGEHPGADLTETDVACPPPRRMRPRLQPRGRHGRHGLHREQQGAVHAVGADQHAPADGGARSRRRALLLLVVGVRLRRRASRPRPTSRRSRRPTPTRPCPRTATAGRSCSASGCAATSARTSASRPASPATTTSTARSAPTTAGARRRRPRSAARSPRPSSSGRHDDRDLGRRRADPQLHVHRRLRARHPSHPRRATSSSRSTSAPIELVTINQLVDIVEEIAGIDVERRLRSDAPQGVRGRNSDNTLIRAELGWEPGIRLEAGLAETYEWISDQLASRHGATAARVM